MLSSTTNCLLPLKVKFRNKREKHSHLKSTSPTPENSIESNETNNE